MRGFIKEYTVEVLAGITVIAITGIFGALRYLFPTVLQSIWQGVTSVGGFLLSPVRLPVWLVGLLVIFSLSSPILFVLLFIPRNTSVTEYPPKLEEYKEDFIFDMVWRWDQLDRQYRPAGHFWCHCPECRTPLEYSSSFMLVGTDAVSSTLFLCERCDKVITEQEGDFDKIRDKVGGRVQGKAISGEWKDVVRRAKAGDLIPKAEEGE